MCGICGVYYCRGGDPNEPDPTRAMAAAIPHRGPDAEGFHATGRVRFGHRRLEIIDLEGGVQPMSNDDESVWITFNGEVFNFMELREELEARGRRFRTRSDTEVLVRAYEEYGTSMVEKLRGQFAFAIYDARDESMLLARDRLGIKPLYYRVEEGRVLFASEIKAILPALDAPPPVDATAVVDYFTYLYVPAPKTIFEGIRKLEPGHVLEVKPDRVEDRRYWDLEFEPEPVADEAALCREIVDRLREAVRIRLVSDVPIGAFLSGGIDSSAVAALMAEERGSAIDTFSVGFRESEWNELPYAREMAARIGSRHVERIVPVDPEHVFARIAPVFDEPFGDSSAIPTYTVSGITREHVTVSLSGDGGDENFAGYRRYWFDRFENRLRSMIPRAVRRGVFGPLASVYPKADWLPQAFRAKTLLGNLAADGDRGYFRTQSALPRTLIDRMLAPDVRRDVADYDAFVAMERHYKRAPKDPLSRIQYVDFKTYLPDDILTKVDRTSMAHSLEVRVPLLDHEFVERVAKIPSGLKLQGKTSKAIFKRALEGIVPERTLHRPKRGFSVPLAQWMRGELAEALDSVLVEPGLDAFLDREAVRGMIAKHRSGVRDFAIPLYSVLAFGGWYRAYASPERAARVEATT